MHATEQPAPSWLDDLAAVIAGWRARRPWRARLLLVLLAAANWAPARDPEPFLPLFALLAFVLPSFRRGRGRGVRAVAVLLVLAGAALSAGAPLGLDSKEHIPAAALLVVGTFVGARHGRWWPWLLPGALAGAGDTGWGWWFDFSVFFGLLIAVLAARVAAVPRGADVSAARDRLAVTAQCSPWRTSFLVCAVAVIVWGQRGQAPALGMLLVALLFHATWRAGTLFDRAAPWAAAVLVPPVFAGIGWVSATLQSLPMGGAAGVVAYAFDPALLAPLVVGIAVGRRAPVARTSGSEELALAGLLVLQVVATVLVLLELPLTDSNLDPQRFIALWRWAAIGLSIPWLVVFHRLATCSTPPRRIVVGAILVGLAHLVAVLLVDREGDLMLTYGGGVFSPIGAWVTAALFVLLARDVARVTRIPDDHPLIADWATSIRAVRTA